MLEAETRAPDFLLPDLNGRLQSLDAILAEGPAAIAFYKISCPVCQFTFPFLERLHQGKAASSPRMFAISQDDAADTLKFNRRFGVTIPTLLDSGDYPVSSAFRIANVPSLFLIEPDRKISWALSGFDKSKLEQLGGRFGVAPFHEGEAVPALRPG